MKPCLRVAEQQPPQPDEATLAHAPSCRCTPNDCSCSIPLNYVGRTSRAGPRLPQTSAPGSSVAYCQVITISGHQGLKAPYTTPAATWLGLGRCSANGGGDTSATTVSNAIITGDGIGKPLGVLPPAAGIPRLGHIQQHAGRLFAAAGVTRMSRCLPSHRVVTEAGHQGR